MKSLKTLFLILASMSFMTVIGGAIYEHIAVVPRWKLAPPASLTMVQGPYGLNSGPFWMSIHPITLVLLIAALLTNWKNPRRKFILSNIAGYALVLLCTATWFVPELMSILHTPYSIQIDERLVARADLWEKLSLLRLVFILPLAAILLLALTKGNEQGRNSA